MRRMNRIALLIGFGTTGLHAEPVPAHLQGPQVRLWYEESGRLSEDIAPPRSITLWNTIIGEGEAEEIANDALFTIHVRTSGEQNLAQPLFLSATDKASKILAQRTFKSILTSKDGNAVVPLWVRDIGCAGTVVFAARIGSERQSFSIDFPCGE
ncbi:hypothetical protein KRR38_10125 [Novosphingobium sp. G106]|uniref:hypothetical protein n=1 Tax=Novosphingobium sp. G106 TaxID=2849500 RepID=UPI001C2D4570|nr:hypothetical protein [Novosphingobium sp. G106]MBV1688021.1 hypothetical protein [Novosphingobium sp. G106]